MFFGLIDRYILRSILPYFFFSLILLTSILLLQQVTKIFVELPVFLRTAENFIFLLYFLLPKTLTFTAPMSCLVSTFLGVSKLKTESELEVMQSAGMSYLRLSASLLLFGAMISSICFFVNVMLSPQLLTVLNEKVSSMSKQDIGSAISIGSFNTDFADMNLYIKDGDIEKGEWRGIFIVKNEGNEERVITASTGHLDYEGGEIELVLNDVTSLRYSSNSYALAGSSSLVFEKLKSLRIESSTEQGINTKRLEKRVDHELLSTEELLQRSMEDTSESAEALISIQRRFALSFAPFLLTIAGFLIGVSFGKNGNIVSLIISLGILLTYYLLFLAGEQLSRTNKIPVFVSGWLSNISLLIGIIFWKQLKTVISGTGYLLSETKQTIVKKFRTSRSPLSFEANDSNTYSNKTNKKGFFIYTFLLEKTLTNRLYTFLFLAYASFAMLVIIFTFFELWKSIYLHNISNEIVTKYLINLLPYVSVQIAGPCCFVASLATYLIVVNRNELSIWLSSGTSIYKLLLPTLVFGMICSVSLFYLQEKIMPSSNAIQDSLRSQIKTGVPRSTSISSGKQWLAYKRTFYSYDFDGRDSSLKSPHLYKVDERGQLSQLLIARKGILKEKDGVILQDVYQIETSEAPNVNHTETFLFPTDAKANLFAPNLSKPLYLNIKQLREEIAIAGDRNDDNSQLRVSLNRRYSDSAFPFIFSILGSAIALFFARGKPFIPVIVSVLLYVVVLAVYQGFISLGSQLGLPFTFICWTPPVLFTALGVYLIASLKT